MSLKQIETLLNKESGLKGICGTNDMRDVINKMETGDDRAKTAIDLYSYRIKKYIGAYFAVLGRVDAVVFTAGIGENAPYIRKLCCRRLGGLGMELDAERNAEAGNGIREISSPNSKVKILVIPTDEELKIAQETKTAVEPPFSGS